MNASDRITSYIDGLGDWRGDSLAQIRKLIRKAHPELGEEWKWNTPVWSHNGSVVAIGAFRDHVKVNFFKGASLDDSSHLFNAGLEAKASRAIDIREGDKLDETALIDLVRKAVALNHGQSKPKKSTTPKKRMA